LRKMGVCARCGRFYPALIEGLCPECFLETRGIATRLRVHVEQCPVCGRFRINGRWTESAHSLEEWLAERVKREYDKVFGKYGWKVAEARLGSQGSFRVEVRSGEGRLGVRGEVELSVERVVCPLCLKDKQESYEAVVQLRAESRDDVEKLREIVNAALGGLPPEKSAEVLSVDELREGFDIKVHSHSVARLIASSIRSRYPVVVRESHKLAKIEGGKRKSKLTISVRLIRSTGFEAIYFGDKLALLSFTPSGRAKLVLSDGTAMTVDRKLLSKYSRPFRGRVEVVDLVDVNGDHVRVRRSDQREEVIPRRRATVLAPIGSKALLVSEDDEFVIFPHPEQ